MSNDILISNVIASNALEVFTGENNALNDFMANVEREALAHVPDVSTAKGRAAITANETKVKKAKLFVEKEGKALADRQKEIPKLIDASRKKSRDFFEALQEKVRLPLTEWNTEQKRIQDAILAEEAEKKRLADEQAEKVKLAIFAKMEVFNISFEDRHTLDSIAKKRAQIESVVVDALFGEFEQKAIEEKQDALDYLGKFELEVAERMERVAREAELIEQGRIAAELANKQAIEKAERERLQAIEDERKRAEAEAAKQKAIEDERARNVAHRTAIKKAVKEALIDAGISDEQAILIVKMACKGQLGAMTIKF